MRITKSSPNKSAIYQWNNRITMVTIVLVMLMVIIGLIVSKQEETRALWDLGQRHGVAPNREALRDFLTGALESRIGSSYSEIHTYLDSIGGEVQYRVEAPLKNRKIERVTWIMSIVPNGRSYIAEWILEYDNNDKLTNITISSSS